MNSLTIWETDFKLALSDQIQLEVLKVSNLISQLRAALSALLNLLLTYTLNTLILFLMHHVHNAIITIIWALAFTPQCSAIVNKSLCLMMLYSLCNVIRVFSALKVIQVLCVHYVSFTHDVHCVTATSSALNVCWMLRSLIMSNVCWTSESLIMSNVHWTLESLFMSNVHWTSESLFTSSVHWTSDFQLQDVFWAINAVYSSRSLSNLNAESEAHSFLYFFFSYLFFLSFNWHWALISLHNSTYKSSVIMYIINHYLLVS